MQCGWLLAESSAGTIIWSLNSFLHGYLGSCPSMGVWIQKEKNLTVSQNRQSHIYCLLLNSYRFSYTVWIRGKRNRLHISMREVTKNFQLSLIFNILSSSHNFFSLTTPCSRQSLSSLTRGGTSIPCTESAEF